MKEITLAAERRSGLGKGFARRTRMEGKIPGVMYGPEIDPVPLAIDSRQFRSAMRSADSSTILNVTVDGQENKALLREVQRDPVTSHVVHVDFHAISMTKPIHVSIPIHFIGEPVGVKVDGGIMQVTMRELNIACLPTDIPDRFEVNVSELGIGDSIHVRDVEIPNAEILAEAQRTMVVISAPTVIKAEEVAAEGEEGELAEGAEAPAEGEAAEAAAEGEEKKEEKKEKEKS